MDVDANWQQGRVEVMTMLLMIASVIYFEYSVHTLNTRGMTGWFGGSGPA